MQITIVGTGYVGLVTGACFAEMGNTVTCVDVDQQKLKALQAGDISIHEPGLPELVQHNLDAGRLSFSTELLKSLNQSEVVFIAVGTPPNQDGSADLTHVLAVASQIGKQLTQPVVIANKSTVPVGTADLVREAVQNELDERQTLLDFDVVSNPEFLREGSAVKDFMYPDRIVIGTHKPKSMRVMEELYDAFAKKENRLQFVGTRDAEMIKYAANAMLATKISFINEIAMMCDAYGIDVENVRKGIGSDPRIGPSFIYAGCGYGGSCFPKDVRAIIHMATEVDIEPGIFRAVEARNVKQKSLLVDKLAHHYGGELQNKTIAIWGLAFKPDTDDVREAPSLNVVNELINKGCRVRAYDPEAMENFKTLAPKSWLGDGLTFTGSAELAVESSDALIVITEWREFKQPDFRYLARTLGDRLIVDGRNIYKPERVADYGLNYIGVGTGNAKLPNP